MDRGTQIAFAVLAVAVVALTFGLVLSLTWDHDPDHMNTRGNDYTGMMAAMGRLDTDEMLDRMRAVLGQERYEAMLDHMEEHRNGTAITPGPGIDGMMHMMWDGMMNQMPAGRSNPMPMMR